MIWWGSKWPISAMVGGRPYSAPHVRPWGPPRIFGPWYWTRPGANLSGGGTGGAIPLGKFVITGHPPGTSARPLETFLTKTRKKKQNCRNFQILAWHFLKRCLRRHYTQFCINYHYELIILGKNCIFFGKFVNKYALKRLKYGILGCFRGVEGAAKKLVFRKFPRYAPEPDPR